MAGKCHVFTALPDYKFRKLQDRAAVLMLRSSGHGLVLKGEGFTAVMYSIQLNAIHGLEPCAEVKRSPTLTRNRVCGGTGF